MRTGDTQSVPSATPDIYVEIQTGTPEDVSSRVVKFHFDEQLYGGVYEIWLDNADSGLASKDYEGYKVDLELGFSGGSRSDFPDLWIEKQSIESSAGKLVLKLTCIDAWGLLAKVNASVGAQYWNYPELAPDEPDADSDHYDKTIKQIVTSVLQEALDNTFAIDDDDSETYFNSLKPPIRIANARTGIFQCMEMTGAYLLYRNDEDFHVIKPSDHNSVYTFALGDNEFWEEAAEDTVLVPNRFIFHGRSSDGSDIDSGNNGLDSTSYARIGIYIDEHYYSGRTEIDLISDQTLLNNLAASTLAKKQGEASQGTLFAPMHCSLELLDKITISDTRYSGTKTITGYVHRIIRDYEANEGIYSIAVQLGGASSAYTPGGSQPLMTKAADIEPSPISTVPFTLQPALSPITLDIDFIADDNDDISWGDGTITCANGKTFSIDSGSLHLDSSDPYYLYYDVKTDDGGLDNTQTFGDAVGTGKLLVAFVKQAPESNQNAMIVPAKGGKGPLLNEDNISANCITATEVYVSQLSAISADMGVLTAGEIHVGSGTWGDDFTGFGLDSSYIAGYNSGVIQVYISSSDGKFYAGGGHVWVDTSGITVEDGADINFSVSNDDKAYIGVDATNNFIRLTSLASGYPLMIEWNHDDIFIISGPSTGIKIETSTTSATVTAPGDNDIEILSADELHLYAADRLWIGAGKTPSPSAGDIVLSASTDLTLGADNDVVIYPASGHEAKIYRGKLYTDLDGGTSYKGKNFADPTSAQDLATKAYVDGKVVSGSYTGDGNDDVAVAHGLGSTPKIVIIVKSNNPDVGFATGTMNINTYDNAWASVTAMTDTYFYVDESDADFNADGVTYYFTAFG